MVWTAKWQLVSIENGEAYLKAIHAPEEFIAKLTAIHAEVAANPQAYIEELTVDKAAGKVQRVVYIKGEKKRDSGLIDIGKEVEHTIGDGRTVKIKITLESDTKLSMHEVGADFTADAVLELHGDEIHATLSSGGVVCKEKYKRV